MSSAMMQDRHTIVDWDHRSWSFVEDHQLVVSDGGGERRWR